MSDGKKVSKETTVVKVTEKDGEASAEVSKNGQVGSATADNAQSAVDRATSNADEGD